MEDRNRKHDLKPCPFCGSAAQLTRARDTAKYWYGECTVCYSRNLVSQTPAAAAERLNDRRLQPKDAPKLVEKKRRCDTKTSGVIVGKDFVKLPPLPAGEAPWN